MNDHSLRNKEELRNKWCSQGHNLKAKVLKQYECPAANRSTPQDRRRWMFDSRDVVWYEGRPGLHEPRSGEQSGYNSWHRHT